MSIEKTFYRLLNPTIKGLLSSPLHRAASSHLMVIYFTGRKSGKKLWTPVRYAKTGNTVSCLTVSHYVWWRNFRGGADVELLIAGKRYKAKATAYNNDQQTIDGMRNYFSIHRQDGKLYGVRVNKQKRANEQDLQIAARHVVYVEFELNEIHAKSS